MKITVPMVGSVTVDFESMKALGEHYGRLSNSYYDKAYKEGVSRIDSERFVGMASAYSVVAWQLQHEKFEISE